MRQSVSRHSVSAERILSLLYESDAPFLSGEDLSRTLDISRSAVWKQIKALRAHGFTITAEPSRGYRLVSSPDRLDVPSITHLLNVQRVGQKIISLEETVSTNAVAFRMAEEGAPEGAVVIAECQTGGKGRLGRRWASPS